MLQLLGIYLLIGLVFGAYFVASGYAKIDNSAATASIGVRLLWLPAATLLWPLLLLRARRGGAQ